MTAPQDDLHRYLQMLAGDAAAGRLLEIRAAIGRGAMRQTFIPATRIDLAAQAITRLGAHTDVYVGVLLRHRRAGGRDACERAHLAFVEIDRLDGLQRLHGYRCAPTAVVSSGSEGHVHAYWELREPVDHDSLEQANRRLAEHLGGDLASVDAARILRPPTSLNRKRTPPAPVRLLGLDPSRRYRLSELTAGLAAPPSRRSSGVGPRRTPSGDVDRQLLAIPAADYVPALCGRQANRAGKVCCPFHDLSVGEAVGDGVSPAQSFEDASLKDRGCSRERTESALRSEGGLSGVSSFGASSDLLRLVPPPVYFERLTGVRVGRSGKVRCLFHDDRNPSLHVYREPGRGWYCFGCGRGGSVYDLAALLSGREPRGRDFSELRRELEELLLPPRSVPIRNGVEPGVSP